MGSAAGKLSRQTLQRHGLRGIHDWRERDLGRARGRPQNADLFFLVRVANPNIEQKPVELCFRERVRAFLFDGILRGENEEGLGQPHGFARGRHPVLLHGLEQRRLRPRRRPVDLIREHDVGEHRPTHEAKAASARCCIFLQQLRAGDVARHEVRRELDSPKVESHGFGDRANHQRLGEARDAHQQRVAAGENGHEDLVEDVALPHDSPRDLVTQPDGGGAQRVALRGRGDRVRRRKGRAQRTGRRRR
jgi:hypothetical protein